MLADMHCHLVLRDFQKDLADVIERAKKANPGFIVSVGGNVQENAKTMEISRKFQLIKPAIGIDPQWVDKMDEAQIEEIADFILKNREKIAMIGEVGLDYSRNYSVEKQKKAFERMIQLSEKTKLSLSIHSREAEQDAFDMVSSSDAKNAVFHCFMGKLSIAKKIADLGHFVSVPTNVVFNSQVQEIAQNIDIRSLVVETDAPFLSPFRGKRNEPAFVAEAVKKIAELKKMKLADVEDVIFENSSKIINAGARI